MKKIFVFLILVALICGVSAQGGSYDSTTAQSAQEKAGSSWFSWWIALFSLEAFTVIFTLGWQFIFVGGIAGFAFLALLQYLGFDIVGWTIEIFRFVFDNVFLLIRWTLSNEANLISMVIILIILWLVILGFFPGISMPVPTTVIYKTVSTTTTTLPWYQFW